MSEVIDFLERMGADARLRDAAGESLEAELESAGIDVQTRAALLNGDSAALEALLGARTNVCCLVEKPDDDEEPAREPPGEPADDEDSEEARVSIARLSAAGRGAFTH